METLNYLVTSDCRKALLNLLWGEGVDGSAHQLKKLANHPYSSVYKELEGMREAGLVEVRNEGRASVYAKKKDPKLNRLMELLLDKKPKTNEQPPSSEDVKVNLVRFGAPLAWDGSSEMDLSLEQTLAFALKLAHEEAVVARSLPVVFTEQSKKLDYAQLEYLANQLGEKQTLGFFLDLTAKLSGNHKMKRLATTLRDKRNKKTKPFFLSDEKASDTKKKLLDLRTPKIAKKWCFQMNMTLESFESLFNKFAKKA